MGMKMGKSCLSWDTEGAKPKPESLTYDMRSALFTKSAYFRKSESDIHCCHTVRNVSQHLQTFRVIFFSGKLTSTIII